MTTRDTFGRDLPRWLREDAEHRVPDHLAEVLERTAATRQRPWWSSPERWIPMGTTTFTRAANLRPLAILVLVLTAMLVAVLGVVYVASQRTAPPFGLADNGLIVVADGTALKAFKADGTAPSVLAQLQGRPLSVSISPDGTNVAYQVEQAGGQRLLVTNLATGGTVEMPAVDDIASDPVSWSPDGSKFTFAGLGDGVEHIYVAAADGSSVAAVGSDVIDERLWIASPAWSPDGRWIAFVGGAVRDSDRGRIFLVNPDGTELQTLEPSANVGDGGGISWAPDPSVQRLLYVVFEGTGLTTRLFDVATGQDYATSLEFWPAWSPDGTRISGCCATVVDTADVLAGEPDPITVFAQPEGNCPDLAEFAGQAICSTATWSPDGSSLIAADIADSSLLIAQVDGNGSVMRLDLETDRWDSARWAWQPIRR